MADPALNAAAPILIEDPPADGDSLICFSHLRWAFVFQRPQHLMTRFARARPVVFWEEPIASEDGAAASLDLREEASGVTVATPRLPPSLTGSGSEAALRELLHGLVQARGMKRPIAWFYTPMMLGFARDLADQAACVVYDCMDELSNFKGAPPELGAREAELLDLADVVFTGGWSLYEAKRRLHANIPAFPSSVDRGHFAAARGGLPVPAAQAGTPRPRLGFYGVIDERLDIELLAALADAHPEWTLVMVGPVVKIDPATLPRRPNLIYPGGAAYEELPAWLAGWDVALMPFAINDSTRFISPTKTPEYLAGGRPVVSTAIADVRRGYGAMEGVCVADTHADFIAGCERALVLRPASPSDPAPAWLREVDAQLADLSWDATQAKMAALIDSALRRPRQEAPAAVSHPAVRPAGRGAAYDWLVVGAGFAGATLAERLASQGGQRVLVIDRRPHVAGNAYDVHDAAGVLIHQYGPHIFHTNSEEVFRHLSRFTAWRDYEHRVLASVGDRLVPIPINRTTLNALYGLGLSSEAEAAAFLASRAEPVERVRTSEDVVVSAVGRELYETFFQGYTRKQWGVDPSQLDKSVTSRVPTRTNTDDRYFTDKFQAMPAQGFTAMFERMLDHPNITVEAGVDHAEVRDEVLFDRMAFTGPIDEFFGFRYGRLPYRSLRFRHETLDVPQLQPVAVINHPHPDTPYTRVSEYKHLTGQSHPKTSITYEYPSAEGDPYYPIPRAENQALYKRYEALALARPDVVFVGRLATYRYYNMDQVTGQALAAWRRIAEQGDRAIVSRDLPVAAVA